jgi:DNA polymerase elongation subunit (family B)
MCPSYSPQAVKDILFIDIETASCKASYEELDEPMRLLWDKKAAALGKTELSAVSELYLEKAAIYAEFGKVIAIGLGTIQYSTPNEEPKLHMQVLSDHDEKKLLEQFRELMVSRFSRDVLRLCAHNGKEFDFPYLSRRMLIHGIPLPPVLNVTGKKPWEINHLDTMEMWKFGDKKSFTSLHLLSTLFGITSSKELMDGSQVHHYYYHKKDLASIAKYCMEDVLVTAQIFLKLNCWETIKEENIVFN